MDKLRKQSLKNIWDKEAESYRIDADLSPDYLAHFKKIETAMGDVCGKKILDAGSGTGITSAYLASKGASLFLVDISSKALQFQKQYFKNKKLKAKYYRADIFALKFPKFSFDVVWNGGVLEHFQDDQKITMLKIMWDLVKPVGKLVVSVPNGGSWYFMLAKQILIWRHKWAFGYEDDLTKTRLAGLAKSAGITGFSIEAYNPITGWWFFPYGKEITALLGLNKVNFHLLNFCWGHNLILTAQK